VTSVTTRLPSLQIPTNETPKVDLSYYWHFSATSRGGTGKVGATLNVRSIPKTSE